MMRAYSSIHSSPSVTKISRSACSTRAIRIADPYAFRLRYNRHAPSVLSFFRRCTRDSDVALDLTAEAFGAA
jgi:DNA-directed RNA polymerase specialized sigma24 family protein